MANQLIYITLALAQLLSVSAASFHSVDRRQSFLQKNGQAAIALNARFATLTEGSKCTVGEQACIKGQFAQCPNGKFLVTGCASGTICGAVPLLQREGTSIVCTTQRDLSERLGSSGGTLPATGPAKPVQSEKPKPDQICKDGDKDSSLTLDADVICKNCFNDGQAEADPGQVPSLTSTNNFISYCKTTGMEITDGQQKRQGSCNQNPMGQIPSSAKMPTVKFLTPTNLGKVKANKAFTVKLQVKNFETGNFVNPKTNYFGAPQQLNKDGLVIGHSHIVIQKLDSMDETTVRDPLTFAFFKGLNAKAVNGVLSTDLPTGLPAGVYKMSTLNTAANHQPVVVAVAQHAPTDDTVYFTVE